MVPKYDMLLSDLQHDILEECCKNQATDYKSLSSKTGRGRTTLIQSLNSLVKNGYIEKQQVSPGHEKSKLIFKPTYKGMAYAWNNIDMDVEDILKNVKNQNLNEYIQLLKEELSDFPRTYLFNNLCKCLFDNLAHMFMYEDSWHWNKSIDAEADNIVKDSFRKGILESIHDDLNYNAKNLLTAKVKEWLMKIYSSEELKEFKEELRKIRNNIDSTIELFPV